MPWQAGLLQGNSANSFNTAIGFEGYKEVNTYEKFEEKTKYFKGERIEMLV